jgi:hypothetical protein
MEVCMKKVALILVGIVGVLLISCIASAVIGLCPPDGPWPLPPWCAGSTISWPFSPKGQPKYKFTEIAGDVEDQSGEVVTQEPIAEEPMELGIAAVTAEMVTDLSLIQEYFDRGITGMAGVTPDIDLGMGFSGELKMVHLACLIPDPQRGSPSIPPTFRGPLGPSGFIGAPTGACAAGANPSVQFVDKEGEKITPELLAEEDVTVIDYDILTGENPEVASVEQILTESIVPGDPDLITPEGWNEKVWQPLKDVQTPMESLLDYQLWNASDEIEEMVSNSVRERMVGMGLPDMVLDAFDQSDHRGWFASRYAEEANELAAMYIVAEFSGDLKGTIEETRTFHIPGAGMNPEFGIMSGDGTVEFDHPELGLIIFDVELEWTEWDDLGRVNGGSMDLIDQAGVYEIHMTFKPDGTKEGELFVNGEYAGLVTLDVEGTSTYLDIQKDESFPLDQLPLGTN